VVITTLAIKPFQRFPVRFKPVKQLDLQTTLQHRAEAPLLAKLFQDCCESTSARNIRRKEKELKCAQVYK